MVYDVKYRNSFEERGATNLGMMYNYVASTYVQEHEGLKTNFDSKCENTIILQNGSIVQFHSNKGVSCSINSERNNEIITYGKIYILQ